MIEALFRSADSGGGRREAASRAFRRRCWAVIRRSRRRVRPEALTKCGVVAVSVARLRLHCTKGRGAQMKRAARSSRTARFRQALLVIIAAAVIALIVLGSAAADTPPYTLPVSLPRLGERAVGRRRRAVHTGRAEPDRPARADGNARRSRRCRTSARCSTTAPSPDCHNVGPVGRPFGLDASGNVAGTTLAAAAAAGATNIKVASVTPVHRRPDDLDRRHLRRRAGHDRRRRHRRIGRHRPRPRRRRSRRRTPTAGRRTSR